ncbi:MAG: hypothetical protein ACKO3N_02805 [Verrucomicrobiota bacterium]
MARDPGTLVAHWSFAAGELARWAERQGPGEWRVRVREGTAAGAVRAEHRAGPGQNHCFVPVASPGGTFVLELGWAAEQGAWHGLASTLPVTTHGEAAPSPTFRSGAGRGVRRDGGAGKTPPRAGEARAARELAWLVVEPGGDRPDGPSSAGLAERGWLVAARTEPAAGWDGGGQERAGGPPGSPADPPPAPPDFWFEVHAEVILHGRTARDASVTIGGRPVRLREDGSFSFRLALPDGDFELPVVAVNAAGTDRRGAAVRLSRGTAWQGKVGVLAQDPALRPPRPEFLG